VSGVNEHFTFNSKRIAKLKMSKDLNRYFSKEDIQMVNKHGKRCFKTLKTRNIQIRSA
jgi:hypothetical protein